MKTRYVFRMIFACFCTLLLGTAAIAQTVQVNGGSTTCTSLTIVTTATGVNLQTVPANCLGTVSAAASISSVAPSCINAGGVSITINGSNLSNATSVAVGGTTVTAFTSNTASAITLTVPATAAAGSGITVTTPAGSASGTFQIGGCVAAPTVTLVALSTAPTVAVASADPGAKLIIKGTGLASASVTINGAPAAVSAGATDTQIEVTVPSSPGSAGIIVSTNGGTANASFTVNGATGGGGPRTTSVTGKTLPAISKQPQEIPSFGDNGAGMNAFDMGTSDCKGSPAPTKSWQHNIDLANYRANAALDFISMGSGQTLSYKFTVPATASGYGSFSTEENTSVITPGTLMNVSSSPCDFDTAKLQPATRDYCFSIINAVANTILYEASNNGAPQLGVCQLKPGQTYYLNFRFLKANGGTYVDSCPTGAQCGATLGFR